MQSNNNLKLLISCPDKQGIVYEVSKYIADNGGNIIDSQQHSLGLDSKFFMRIEIDISALQTSLNDFKKNFEGIAGKFQMNYCFNSGRKSMAILVSKHDHCLYDVLQKQKNNNLNVDIPIIISNHPDLEHVAQNFDIEFQHIPITAKTEKAKQEQEKQILTTLAEHQVDFVALARYMQILSSSFINQHLYKIINVHHSFLPSFKGASPYQQAYDKGVKIIGATAHYATEELDMGPIICQDVRPVSYKHSAEDYKAIGRDIEEIVFSRAIKAHSEDKILIYENKTIVFD